MKVSLSRVGTKGIERGGEQKLGVIKNHGASLKGREFISYASLSYSSGPVCPEINEHERTHIFSVGKYLFFPKFMM